MRIINFADGFQSNTAPIAQPIPAIDITVSPVGNLTETNVQSALEGIYTKHIDLTAGVHGVTSNVVGVNDSQTLTNKLFAQALLSTGNNFYNIGSLTSKWKNLYLGSNAYVDGDLFVYGATALFDTDTVGTSAQYFDLNIAGLDSAAEGVGIRVKRNTGGHYQLIFDSTLQSGFKLGAAGSESEILTSGHTQELTNKIIDADNNTITNIANDEIKVGANIDTDKLAPGNPNYAMIRDGAGKLSDEQYLNRTRGGTGITSTAIFPAIGTIVTRDATETLQNKTLENALLSGGSLNVSSAGAFALLASVGGYNLTLGGALSTVVIPGNLQVEGGVTYVNTTDLEVTDKNILVNKGGNAASMTGAGLTVDNTEGVDGSFVYDSTLASKWKCGLVGSEIEIVNISSSQSLTNKTLVDGTINNTIGGTAIIDTDDLTGAASQKLATSRAIKTYVDNQISGYTTDLLSLTDTPADYTGHGAKLLTVNDTPNGVSFRSLIQTLNQVLISEAVGGYTFSLPQNIHDGATPTFAGLRIKPNDYYCDISINSNLTANRNLAIDTNDKDLTVELGIAEDGNALVWSESGSKWTPGASGDNSFKIQGVGTTADDILIKGGLLRDGETILITDDGTDDIYKGGLAIDIEYQIGATDLDGGAKANNTNYWLYIDKENLNDVTVQFAAGQNTPLNAKSVTPTDFVYSTKTPESGDINTENFVPIGYFKTDGAGNLDTTAFSFLEVIPRVTKAGSGGAGGGAFIKEEIFSAIGNHTYVHGQGKKPSDVELFYMSNGGLFTPLNKESYVKDITINDIDINLDNLDFSVAQYVVMRMIWFVETIALSPNEWESPNWITSTSQTDFNHNIGKYPKGITILYDDNGTVKPLDHFSYIDELTTTQVKIDFGTLVIDATHKIKIFLSSAAIPSGILVEAAGTIKMFGSDTAPEGFLICDGAEVSRSTYADLFAIIGESFGNGDGSTTFDLPNFKDKFPKGKNTDSIGDTGGTNTISGHTHNVTSNVSVGNHSLSIANLPNHNHSINHTHSSSSVSGSVGGSDGTHTHTMSLPVGYSNIIMYKGSGTSWGAPSGTDVNIFSPLPTINSTNSEHGHGHSLTAAGQSYSGNSTSTGSGTAVSHSVTNTTETSTSAGGHDNRPEYLTVNYIIKT